MRTFQEDESLGGEAGRTTRKSMHAPAVREIFGEGWATFVGTLDLMSQAVVVLDQESRVVFANQSVRQRLNVVGTPFPTERDRFLALMTPLDSRGQPLPKEAWPSIRALRGESGFEVELNVLLKPDRRISL